MSDDNIPLEIQIERSAVESLLRFGSAVEFATDYCVRHAQPNKIMANEDFSNNFYMAKTFATTHPEIVAILRGHPLYPALSKKVTVPQTYLMQLWNSLTFVPGTINDSEFFYFKLTSGETFRLRLDLDLFRRAIGFPLSNVYPDKPSFESVPSESTIFKALNNLGYEGRFNKVSEFKRNLFAKRWCILFMILNRCLTHSYSGIDSLTKPVAQILYGVAYHRHFDFAHIIWTNLIKIVSKKQKYAKYTPYIRFLSIILDHFLAANPQIPALTDRPVLLSSMKYTQDNTGSNIAQPAHIPRALLVLADRNDKAIMRYRELVARMEPVQPQAPAPRAHSPPGEGSRVRGSKRKSHEGKRKEGDLGDSTAQERCQKRRHDRQEQQPTIEPITKPIPQLPQTEPTDISVPAITLPLSQDPTPSPSIGHCKFVGVHKKKKLHKRRRVLEVVADEAQVTSAQQSSVPASGSHDAERPFTDTAFAFGPIEPASDLELQGGHEGVVEKSKESERSEREIGQKERVSPPRTSPKQRVTTSATATHVLRQSIEEVASCPPVQAQTHPSHSVSQQREIVSCVHGDSPHTLPVSHLETRGIELRDTPSQSRPSTHAHMSSTPRTLSIESSSLSGSANLRDVAGTSEGSTASTVRGSLGNPTSVITTPALNGGHSTRLCGVLVVSTERLSGTEHSFTFNPAFASHFTSMTRAQVHSHSSATMTPLHISQSQTPPTPSTSQTQSQTSVQLSSSPSSSQSQPPLCNPFTQPLPPHLSQSLNPQTINFRDLKALFYAQLLIRPNRTPTENAILSLMNSELSSNTPPQIELSPVLSRLDQIDRRLATLESYKGLYLPNEPRNQNPQ